MKKDKTKEQKRCFQRSVTVLDAFTFTICTQYALGSILMYATSIHMRKRLVEFDIYAITYAI